MKKCEICGYEVSDESTTVHEYPDGISRCKVCASIACHGRYIRNNEVNNASEAQLEKWAKDWKEWIHRLASS